jgi:hypothetical protein
VTSVTRRFALQRWRQAVRTCAALCALGVLWQPAGGLAEDKTQAPQSPAAPAAAPRDGQHDFDFSEGTWHTHIVRRLDPFDDKSPSIELEGTVSSRKVWGGRAWLEQIQADGPKGHWQALSLFLYNPRAQQWSQSFINSKVGVLGAPFVGAFKDGHGELLCQDTFKDKSILARAVWSNITANAHRYEEFFSDDGGKTWRISFTANKTRIPASEVRPVQDVANDFDFDVGSWKLHTSRLLKPLTGSTQWVEADGRVVVTKIWDGSANLAEIHTDYPTGPVDFLALRWYNPVARQWFNDFATAAGGQLGVPAAGEFKDGRVEFYDQEEIDGKAVLVRFSIWPTSQNGSRSEQAFSADGGKTWEVNFRTQYTRG